MSEQDKLVGSDEAMNILGISRPTLDRWIASGLVPAHRVGRNYKYYPDELRKVHNLSAQQACELLGIGRSRLKQWSAAGTIPCKKMHGQQGRWMYNRDELVDWVLRKRVKMR